MNHTDGQVVCPDCGSSSYLMVDGRRMSREMLLRLPRAPKEIKRVLPHQVWCPSQENRLSL